MGVDFDQVKEGAKAMWSLGDYSVLATSLEPAARDLVEACGISSRQDVLDVAAGNGNCAIAAARKGARVVASDLTPAQVELGRARTAAEGLDIEWTEADAEDLPFEAGRFDCVTSVFGAMIAPRQETVASELFRVVRSGGTVGMANWTPESFMKKMGDVGSKYAPPSPPDLPSAFRWGEEDAVRSLFEGMASSIELDRRTLMWEYASWDEMRKVGESFGGAVMAKRMLPPEVYAQMNEDMETLFREHNQGTEGQVVIENEYLRVVARKA
jgi:ubiquinone/menaquinone biosynthesis C-methylase UbiE